MKNTWLRIAVVTLGIVLMVACSNDTSCREERYVAAGVKLYRTTFDEEEETYVINAYTPDSISVYGAENDSILYSRVSLNTFNLPLRTDSVGHCTTKYVFLLDADKYDTVTIQHLNTDNYLSLACGCVVFADILEVSSTVNYIDSVVIVNSAVQNVIDTHLNVYYK